MLFREDLILFFVDKKSLSQFRNLFICLFAKSFELFLKESNLIFFEMIPFTELVADDWLFFVLRSDDFEFLLHLSHDGIMLEQYHLYLLSVVFLNKFQLFF